MKIALAQLNYHIGFFEKNLEKISVAIHEASESGAGLIIFSELALCGYPPQDLLFHESFISKNWQYLNQIATLSEQIDVIIGAPYPNDKKNERPLLNAALFFSKGKLQAKVGKKLLPNYDVFDEMRYFQPGENEVLIHSCGKKIALTICEDLWSAQEKIYEDDPMVKLAAQKPDLIVNIAASPFDYNQAEKRVAVMQGQVKKYQLPSIYLNQIGAHSELIFDGGSFVINQQGQIVCQLPLFEEKIAYTELPLGEKTSQKAQPDRHKVIYDALVFGLREFFDKKGFKKAVLGLSGGIDSALTLVIAVDALGKENVLPVMLPSPFSSTHSVTDSEQLCESLGVRTEKVSIDSLFRETQNVLAPFFEGTDFGIAEENIQSRLRGLLLMAYSNKFGHILLNTTNKSEAAVGYGTLYGDLCGGISVLGDVYKTQAYDIAKMLNAHAEVIPENILTKAPSAELRENQKDSDSLPEYDLLDKILFSYIEEQKSVAQVSSETGVDRNTTQAVIDLVNMNEYKRYQMAPVLRVSPKAFGIGRRYPLVAKFPD